MSSHFLIATAWAIPSFQTIKTNWHSSDIIFQDRHGIEIQRIRIDKKQRKLNWIDISAVSAAFRHAIILSEDKKFYQHSGVDWSAVLAASWGNLWNQRTRGASTLTMQLIGLIDPTLKKRSTLFSRERRLNFWQKIDQAFSARKLEKSWSKTQILEGYLNLVSFRGEIIGISALSAAMFGKDPSGLDANESAIAVALLRAPNAPAAQVAQRACQILRDMNLGHQCASILGETTLAFTRQSLYYPIHTQLAPHFAYKLFSHHSHQVKAGATIRTTLDAHLQRYTRTVLKQHLAELNLHNVEDGAVLVLDNKTGDILAWVGSSGNLSRAGQWDGVTSKRQAGSILKPFLYQIAIEGKWLTAASLLNDSPINLATPNGIYAPQNYVSDFKGPVSVRTALASSLNTPAVRAIEIVTPFRFHQRLLQLGIDSLTQLSDYYGYSLALGAADVRLYDVTNAYRTLANLGLKSQPRWTLDAPYDKAVRVLDTGSSFIIGDILSDRTARTRTFGLESALGTRFWSAVKTGTSKDMRDNWTVGYSKYHTVGVWVGNASGTPMQGVSGMHGAAPIWLSVMNYLQQIRPSRGSPDIPASVYKYTVHFEQDIEAARSEYFLKGTARPIIYLTGQQAVPIISSPINRTVYAIDPDIPPVNQKIAFQCSGFLKPTWWLDGTKLGGGNPFFWPPWPGQHTLQLRDRHNKVIQTVHFEVRASLR